MPDVEVSIDILAPPARVWAVVIDVDRWPEWTPTTRSVERLDAAPLHFGSRTRVRQPKLLPAVWQVTQLDQEHGIFIWRSRSPGVVVAAGHHVEATTTGCRVTLALAFSGFLGPLMAHLFRKLNQRYLALEANGLKSRCEAA